MLLLLSNLRSTLAKIRRMDIPPPSPTQAPGVTEVPTPKRRCPVDRRSPMLWLQPVHAPKPKSNQQSTTWIFLTARWQKTRTTQGAVWGHHRAAQDLLLEAAARAALNNLIWAQGSALITSVIHTTKTHFGFAVLVSSASFCSIRYNPCHRETACATPRYPQRGHSSISQPSAGSWASFPSIYTTWEMLRDTLPKWEQQEDKGRCAAAAPPIRIPRALLTPRQQEHRGRI